MRYKIYRTSTDAMLFMSPGRFDTNGVYQNRRLAMLKMHEAVNGVTPQKRGEFTLYKYNISTPKPGEKDFHELANYFIIVPETSIVFNFDMSLIDVEPLRYITSFDTNKLAFQMLVNEITNQ